jgi:GTP-binding protein YchF
MNLSLGIVGLPNVGKSSLFNALTKLNVLSANYPFATIDPNTGVVPLNDSRLHKLAELSGSKETIPAVVEFVDIAGLVRGAASGQGLGNKFLGHIKEVGAILHLVRYFEDPNIIHVENRIHPKDDIEIINSELILKDIETIEKRINDTKAKNKAGKDPKIARYIELLEALNSFLNQGKLANKFEFTTEDQKESLRDLNLITIKPMIYVANVSEDQLNISDEELRRELGLSESDIVTSICVKTEAELVELSEEDQREYLESLGLKESGLDKISRIGYKTLGLLNFFTTGEKETRAWTIKENTKAPQAASAIHTDFEKNFIALDVVKYDDLVNSGSWTKAKEAGKLRLEGREYIVQDGDVVIVKHN